MISYKITLHHRQEKHMGCHNFLKTVSLSTVSQGHIKSLVFRNEKFSRRLFSFHKAFNEYVTQHLDDMDMWAQT